MPFLTKPLPFQDKRQTLKFEMAAARGDAIPHDALQLIGWLEEAYLRVPEKYRSKAEVLFGDDDYYPAYLTLSYTRRETAAEVDARREAHKKSVALYRQNKARIRIPSSPEERAFYAQELASVSVETN